MAHSATSGAGTGELGELRLLPFAGAGPPEQWLDSRSAQASPGRFAARVGARGKAANVRIESTATTHGAVHRFTFPPKEAGRAVRVLLSEASGSFWGYKLMEHTISLASDRRLEGCTVSQV